MHQCFQGNLKVRMGIHLPSITLQDHCLGTSKVARLHLLENVNTSGTDRVAPIGVLSKIMQLLKMLK